jgi:hypothetical protein
VTALRAQAAASETGLILATKSPLVNPAGMSSQIISGVHYSQFF